MGGTGVCVPETVDLGGNVTSSQTVARSLTSQSRQGSVAVSSSTVVLA